MSDAEATTAGRRSRRVRVEHTTGTVVASFDDLLAITLVVAQKPLPTGKESRNCFEQNADAS